MLVPVTAIYAALLGLVGIALQQAVGLTRLRAEVSLGDGGRTDLLEAMRRQANFVEQVPLALILLALLELNGAPASWLHSLGVALLACRVVHPFGLRAGQMRVRARGLAALGTLLIMLAAIALNALQVLTT